MAKLFPCGNEHATIDEVRGCHLCQRNGSAANVHAKFQGSDPVEVLDPPATEAPTVAANVAPFDPLAPAAKPKRVRKPAARRTTARAGGRRGKTARRKKAR